MVRGTTARFSQVSVNPFYKPAPYKTRVGSNGVKTTDVSSLLSLLAELTSTSSDFYTVEVPEGADYTTLSNGAFEVDYALDRKMAYVYKIDLEKSKAAGWGQPTEPSSDFF